MNGIFSRLSTRNWLFYVTVMCFLLGGLLAANLNTQGSLRAELGAGGSARLPWLVETLKEQRDTNAQLKNTINDLREQVADYEADLAKSGRQASTLNRELQDLKFLVGLTAAVGPGVVVTLNDDRSKKIGDPESDLYIVHDYDLRNLVNELFSAGAEAIAINDQRIVARTAIRCVGPNIMINGEPTAAEFVVRAIGSSHDLEGALNIPNGIIDVLRMGVKVKVEKSEKVQVPAFSGATHVKHARPAGPGQE
jgi:uncharacterized protein YlxW (UPF0749 family)